MVAAAAAAAFSPLIYHLYFGKCFCNKSVQTHPACGKDKLSPFRH
jgi:hypothetical protein